MSDWIGFFVSIAFLLYLLFRGRPAKEPLGQEDTLKEFLQGLKEDMTAKKMPTKLPSLPKVVKPQAVLPIKPSETGIVSAYFEKGVQYDVVGKDAPSRGHRILENLRDKRDMVILHEIIGPPKCKRR